MEKQLKNYGSKMVTYYFLIKRVQRRDLVKFSLINRENKIRQINPPMAVIVNISLMLVKSARHPNTRPAAITPASNAPQKKLKTVPLADGHNNPIRGRNRPEIRAAGYPNGGGEHGALQDLDHRGQRAGGFAQLLRGTRTIR